MQGPIQPGLSAELHNPTRDRTPQALNPQYLVFPKPPNHPFKEQAKRNLLPQPFKAFNKNSQERSQAEAWLRQVSGTPGLLGVRHSEFGFGRGGRGRRKFSAFLQAFRDTHFLCLYVWTDGCAYKYNYVNVYVHEYVVSVLGVAGLEQCNKANQNPNKTTDFYKHLSSQASCKHQHNP